MWKKKIGTWGGVHLESKKKKRKVGILILSITLGLVLLLGLSYAWFTLTLNGTKQNVIKVGKLSLTLDDSISEGITLQNAIPTYTDTALVGKPYTFTLSNEEGNIDTEYSLYLDDTGTIRGSSLNRFNYLLKKDGKVLRLDTLGNLYKAQFLLSSGTIRSGETNEYQLYIWLDANTTDSQGQAMMDKTYQSTLRLEANQPKKQKLSTLIASYDCGSNSTICKREVEDITYFQQGYFGSPKYIWYSGKMWIPFSYDNEGNIKAITASEQVKIPWGSNTDYNKSYVKTWLNEEFLPTLNNYQKVLMTNHTWNYSVQPNDNYYQTPLGNTNLVTSAVGLLTTWDLHQASDYDGIMTSNDYVLGVGGCYYLGTPLENGRILLGGNCVVSGSSYNTSSPTNFYGVSPAVIFQKDVNVIGGSGTLSDPYRLEGDNNARVGDLLNTRYSGEYVSFGEGVNSSYRISKMEDGKTKLIATRSLIEIETDATSETFRYFATHWLDDGTLAVPYFKGSGDYLHYVANSTDYPVAYYLNHNFLDPKNGFFSALDKTMILENQTWYTATIGAGDSYKNAKDSTKSTIATVGLPILGETSTSFQIEDDVSIKNLKEDWTPFLTNNGEFPYSFHPGYRNNRLYDEGNSWRPMLYLKETVKIKGGSGTKNDPYILKAG